MTRPTYPQIEQFETHGRELRANLRLLQEQRDASRGTSPARPIRLRRLVALTVARVGGR